MYAMQSITCILLDLFALQQTGLTPLMEAASGGYVEVGRVLLDKGADINAAPVPVSRDTALTIAADKGHHRFVELLISR
jgi:ankyrin repeat protein